MSVCTGIWCIKNCFFLKSKAKHQRREIISCCIEIPSGVVLRFALALQLNLCYTPSLLIGPQIGPCWSVWSNTGTSFSPRGETKILWTTPMEQSLGCRRPRRAKVARWFLGYSRHGRSGSCKPIGCLGSSGCSPCPPTAHWTFCLQRTWTAMTTPGDTIGLGHQRHHHRQLTKRPSTRTANWGPIFDVTTPLGWPQISNISEEMKKQYLITRKLVDIHFPVNKTYNLEDM